MFFGFSTCCGPKSLGRTGATLPAYPPVLKMQIRFNVSLVYSKLPPPSTDCRRQCLNRTDAKVVSPPPGGIFGGGVAPVLKLDRRQGSVTNAKTSVRWGGGVCCRTFKWSPVVHIFGIFFLVLLTGRKNFESVPFGSARRKIFWGCLFYLKKLPVIHISRIAKQASYAHFWNLIFSKKRKKKKQYFYAFY